MNSTVFSAIVRLLAALVLWTAAGCHAVVPKTYPDPLDLSARDTSVSPADNFFAYANGTWMKDAKIPADRVRLSGFDVVQELNIRLKSILDSCRAAGGPGADGPAARVGDMYRSVMDTAEIDKAGPGPLQADLDRIAGIRTSQEVIGELAGEYTDGDWKWDWYNGIYFDFDFGQLCTFFVDADGKNSAITRLHCNQGGLGLPNKTYYLKTDSLSRSYQEHYRGYISEILTLIGDHRQAAEDARDIFSLERRLAEASRTPVELRDPQANYHLTSVAGMKKLSPAMYWDELLRAMDVRTDTLLVGQPEYFVALSGLLREVPVSVWRKYLSFHLVSRYSPWLSRPFSDAHFEFYGRILGGQQKPRERWEKAVGLINNTLGDDLGKLYVDRYFPPSSKASLMDLVENIRAAFAEHIEHLDWMSDSTKARALDKLNAMKAMIGYPDEWKDYSSVAVSSDSLIGNLKRIGRWYYRFDMDKLHKPEDRSEWRMTATTLNAYYRASSNNITVPAVVFVPPFYFTNGDDAVNYGAIGTIIGHEMTHGFDDRGSHYDPLGSLRNWWSAEDRDRFNERAARIVRQYNQYTILDTVHINGRLTEGENIADLGGESIAYTAFQNTVEAHKDTLIDGLTPDQRFFMATAQQMRNKSRPQILLTQVLTDPHSPWEYRLNGPLSNMVPFYMAFKVKPEDKMYRADSVRVKIW